MEQDIKSVLQFENYIVKSIKFTYNMEYNKDEPINIDFDVDAEYYFTEDGGMQVILKTCIFNDVDTSKYPFSMEIEVVGFFFVSGSSKEQIEMFKPNAAAILFPYVRALVSSYTANANVTPLVLPPININKLLKK